MGIGWKHPRPYFNPAPLIRFNPRDHFGQPMNQKANLKKGKLWGQQMAHPEMPF
jgi:hypothetical protein